jgi:Tol biopolymer transport system component
MSYLRTMLASAIFLLVLVFPAWGQQPTPNNANNDMIVFGRVPEGGSSELFMMRPDGTATTQLTNTTLSESSPAWSPDGTKIAFAGAPEGTFEVDIHAMNTDGSNRQQLTTSPASEYGPAWSPDGSKIAFERDLPIRENEILPKIFVMNADGSKQVQLRSDRTSSESSPAWSPDGSKIVFVGVIAGSEEIYTMNVDGSDLKQLTESANLTKEAPDWSPDGSKIVFGAYDRNTGGKYDIFVMNADGSEVTNLTNNPNSNDIRPVWSPDGREIAFVRDPDLDTFGDSDIWRMRAEGSSPTQITSNTVDDSDPDWQVLTSRTRTQGNGDQRVIPQRVIPQRVIPEPTSRRSLPPTGGAAILASAIGLLLISGTAARLVMRRR